MLSIYIASLSPGEGKTALCLGLARRWQQAGKKIGFFKPVQVADSPTPDGDALFAKKTLGLAEAVEPLCPLSLPPQRLEGLAQEPSPDSRLRQAWVEVSQGKDFVLVEGLSGHPVASARLARWLGAKAIGIAHYRADLPQELTPLANSFGSDLSGVVVNAAPSGKLDQAHTSLVPYLERAGLKVLGVLPQERSLAALSVGELVEPLQARVMAVKDGLGELVENLMVGSIFLDPGPLYFGRRANKAAITRSDRPDVALGALETPTRCLILTAAQGDPNPYVYYKAMDMGVPILVTPMVTQTALDAIESTLAKARFRQEKKLAPLQALLGKHLDFSALERALGI